MRCVRIRFSKTGRIKYVSHLDIMRAMTRAVRRADIPLWYTEGFNPHPYLNFLQPLPLGVEGMAEPLDIRIEGEISNEEIKQRINAVLPVGLQVTRVFEPYMKASDIAAAGYEILFENEASLSQSLKMAMDSGELSCEKIGKVNGRKRVKQVNISESITEYAIEERPEGLLMTLTLPAGNTKNVNPVSLLTALGKYLERELPPLNIKRTGLLTESGEEFE